MPNVISYLEGIRSAQEEEMARDERVIVLGEDIRKDMYGSTGLLHERFGDARVLDTPMSENAFVGCGVGAAMTGLRPIVDVSMAAFLYCAADQIISQASKNTYMFGAQRHVPITIRCGLFYNRGNAAHHADRNYSMFMNVPGLKIIAPASPADAKGLLKSAIREDDPVLCFEDSTCWSLREEVPDEDYTIPLGVGRLRHAGDDVTIVAIAGAVLHACAAAEQLAAKGIYADVIDPRTLVPLDRDMICRSVSRTGRLVVVDPAPRTCSAASEIAATVAEDAFGALKAPILRVTAPDVPIPFSRVLERQLYPDPDRIVRAVERLLAR